MMNATATAIMPAIPTSGLIVPYAVLETLYSKSWLEQSETTRMIVATAVITAIAIPTTVLRVISRLITLRKLGSDDYLMVISSLFSIIGLVITIINGTLGCGKHTVVVPIQNLYKLLKLVYAEEIIYLTTLGTLKQSILGLYLRLSPAAEWRNMVIGASALNIGVTISMILFNAFQCNPIAAAWLPLLPGRKCMDTAVLLLVPPALNLFVDFVILILPVIIIGPLKVTLKRKLQIGAVLGVGALSIIVSAVRMHIFKNLVATYSDSTYTLATISWTSALELQIATIAANIPAIRSLWSHHTEGRNPSNASYELSDDVPVYSKGRKCREGSAKKSAGASVFNQSVAGGSSADDLVNAETGDSAVLTPTTETTMGTSFEKGSKRSSFWQSGT